MMIKKKKQVNFGIIVLQAPPMLQVKILGQKSTLIKLDSYEVQKNSTQY